MKIIAINKNKTLDESLLRIKAGDKSARELLIESYIPFIIKTASKYIGGYLDMSSDEYSISLMAFNEAIDKYEASKGGFIGYAALVINNRLKDHSLKNKRYHQGLDEMAVSEDIKEHGDFTERLAMKNQIEIFTEKLQSFDITLSDLVKESPKHYDTRIRSVKMAKYIIDMDELKANFYRLKRLPVLVLSKVFEVAKKTIKRTRKFTIATTIVLDSELNLLKSHVLQIERGDDHE